MSIRKGRWLLLPVAAVVITGIVLFRERQLAEWTKHPPTLVVAPRRLAPRFTAVDHHRHIVKLERFLGRQRVVLVFFDPQQAPDADPIVQSLEQCHESLQRSGIEVLAISNRPPAMNAQSEQDRGRDYPFPILSDISPTASANDLAHRLWGRYDEQTNQTRPGLFLIARDGTVPITPEGFPLPVPDVDAALTTLCSGQWPR